MKSTSSSRAGIAGFLPNIGPGGWLVRALELVEGEGEVIEAKVSARHYPSRAQALTQLALIYEAEKAMTTDPNSVTLSDDGTVLDLEDLMLEAIENGYCKECDTWGHDISEVRKGRCTNSSSKCNGN